MNYQIGKKKNLVQKGKVYQAVGLPLSNTIAGMLEQWEAGNQLNLSILLKLWVYVLLEEKKTRKYVHQILCNEI